MILRLSTLCALIVSVVVLDKTDSLRIRRQDEETTPAEEAATSSCIKCKSADACMADLGMTMDCTKEKLSELGFAGAEQALWEALKPADNADLDDPTKYTHCVTLQVAAEMVEIRGCVPEKIGEDNFCDFVTKTSEKNVSLCNVCAVASGAMCNKNDAPLKGGETATMMGNDTTTQKGKSGTLEIKSDFTVCSWFIISVLLLKLVM